MQTDMHYHVIYYLCLAAGFAPDDAYVVAFCSEYVDESLEGRTTTVIEPDGKRHTFEPTRTAHMGLEFMGTDVQEKVYLPFHFLPSFTSAEDFDITRSGFNGRLFRPVLAEALKSRDLHRIGITLHVLADTFSHEPFSGYWSWANVMHTLAYIPYESNSFKALIGKLWFALRRFFTRVAPSVGHAQAETFPDQPFLHWRYDDWRKGSISIANPFRFMNAMRILYLEFIRQIEPARQPLLSDDEVYSRLWRGIHYVGSTGKRCEYWRERTRELGRDHGLTIPEQHLTFSVQDWVKPLGTWTTNARESTFRLKVSMAEFGASHLVRFHKQALEHRLFLLHYLSDPQQAAAQDREAIAGMAHHFMAVSARAKRRKVVAG